MSQSSNMARTTLFNIKELDSIPPGLGLSHNQPRFFSRYTSDLTGSRDPQADSMIHMTERFDPQSFLLGHPFEEGHTSKLFRSEPAALVPLPQKRAATLKQSDSKNGADWEQENALPIPSQTFDGENNNSMLECKSHPFDLDDYNGNVFLANLTSTGRRSRSHVWPPMSDPPPLEPCPHEYTTRTIGHTGRDSGRNLLALFEDGDGVPRTRYNLRVLRARGPTYLPDVQHYPPSNVDIPGGLSLWEICQFYPRHVWGTCLRMFIAEGWAGEQIFNALPSDFKDSRAIQRPWNYIQQGFTREVRRMNEESGIAVRNARKSKRAENTKHRSHGIGIPHTRPPVSEQCNHSKYPLLLEQPVASRTQLHQPSAEVKTEYASMVDPKAQDISLTIKLELEKQEVLLLAIMEAFCAELNGEPLNERLDRVRYCRQNILRQHGIDMESTSLEQLAELTYQLEGVLQRRSLELQAAARDWPLVPTGIDHEVADQ